MSKTESSIKHVSKSLFRILKITEMIREKLLELRNIVGSKKLLKLYSSK
jgi:hypothetical protein